MINNEFKWVRTLSEDRLYYGDKCCAFVSHTKTDAGYLLEFWWPAAGFTYYPGIRENAKEDAKTWCLKVTQNALPGKPDDLHQPPFVEIP